MLAIEPMHDRRKTSTSFLEENIEARKGRMKYLENRVAFATLNLSIIEYHPILAEVDNNHFGKQIGNAFIAGFNGVLDFLIGLVRIWPLLIFIGLLLFGLKRITKRRLGWS